MALPAVKSYIRDEKDSDRKLNAVRGMAHNNPEMALKMAEAIAKDDSLLSGLTAVVAALAKHEKCLAILVDVFNRPGVQAAHKTAFQVIQRANLHAAFL